MDIKNLSNIINDVFNYKNINKKNDVKLRNIKNGVTLSDALYYKLLYTDINSTKEEITSKINSCNNKSFDRGSYESKQNNISINIFLELLNKIAKFYNEKICNENIKLMGIDGTYNNDNNYNEIMNMGFYDITNSIPVHLKSYGTSGKNNEVKSTMTFIQENIDVFRNTIIVCDRAYHCYDFFMFLMKNKL